MRPFRLNTQGIGFINIRMPSFKSILGQRFGRLIVIDEPRETTPRRVVCRCDCGKQSHPFAISLRSGNAVSCGCYAREKTAARYIERNTKHGFAQRNKQIPEYRTWFDMKRRCYDKNRPDYVNYGGRGIYVVEEWRTDFAKFLADMGRKPNPKSTIDRIDNDGPYAPWNCRWATRKEQNNNKRRAKLPSVSRSMLTFNGETLTMSAWGRRVGISGALISERIHRGWTVERAITQPARKDRRRTA